MSIFVDMHPCFVWTVTNSCKDWMPLNSLRVSKFKREFYIYVSGFFLAGFFGLSSFNPVSEVGVSV